MFQTESEQIFSLIKCLYLCEESFLNALNKNDRYSKSLLQKVLELHRENYEALLFGKEPQTKEISNRTIRKVSLILAALKKVIALKGEVA